MKLPSEIVELVTFLKERGLTLFRKEGPSFWHFGNVYMEYEGANVRVQAILDRGDWSIALADAAKPATWYDVGILRDLVLGVGSDASSLPEQVRLIEKIWQEVIDAFATARRESSHARLDQLAKERAIRIFASWSDAALDLEAFLSKQGLTCRHRDAPQGSFGERLMEYVDSVIGVRITCGGPPSSEGWRVAVADATQPDRWYDISLIHCIIEHTADRKMPYLRRFEFVKDNWAEIRQLFCDSCRESTQARLAELLAASSG